MTKVTPFLTFNDQLDAAMEFYTATFPDSEIRSVARTGKGRPGFGTGLHFFPPGDPDPFERALERYGKAAQQAVEADALRGVW